MRTRFSFFSALSAFEKNFNKNLDKKEICGKILQNFKEVYYVY